MMKAMTLSLYDLAANPNMTADEAVREILLPDSMNSDHLYMIADDTNLSSDKFMLKIDLNVPTGVKPHVIKRVAELKEAGLEHGFTVRGTEFRQFLAGASMTRQGKFLAMNKQIINDIGIHLCCGLDPRRLMEPECCFQPNKWMAYMGLSMSMFKSFKSLFGATIDIDRVCVLPAVFTEISGMFDITEDRVWRKIMKVPNNITDGLAFIRRELCSDRAFTGRMPWMKFAACPQDWDQFAKSRGVGTIVKDVFGHDVDLSQMDLIIFVDNFKAFKEYRRQFGSEGWNVYKTAFKNENFELGVCVQEHNNKGRLDYQKLQTLVAANKADIEELYDETAGKTDFTKMKYVHRLASGPISKAIRMYPALAKDQATWAMLEGNYRRCRHRLAGASVPGISRNPFVFPDPIAVMEGMYGLPVKGVLADGECSCSMFKAGKVDITRSPHLDNAHCVRINRRIQNAYFIGTSMFVSAFDAIVRWLQMDFDGDHVNVTQNKTIIRLAEKTHEILGDAPLFYEAEDAKAPKKPQTEGITRRRLINFLKALEPANVGQFANGLTKVWSIFSDLGNNPGRLARYHQVADKIAQLTKSGNLEIDAAKHAMRDPGDPIVISEGARAAQELSSKKVHFPMFMKYAKGTFAEDGEESDWDEKVDWSNGVGDLWCATVLARMPEKLAVPELENLTFDPSMLIASEMHAVPGLFSCDTGYYSDMNGLEQGWFNRMVTRYQAEAKMYDGRACEFNEAWRETVHAELTAFANNVRSTSFPNGASLLDCVRYLVCRMYTAKKFIASGEKRVNFYRMLLWSWFGDEILVDLQENIARVKAGNYDLAEFPDDPEDEPIDDGYDPDYIPECPDDFEETEFDFDC